MTRDKSSVPKSYARVREFTNWIEDMDLQLLITMVDEARS